MKRQAVLVVFSLALFLAACDLGLGPTAEPTATAPGGSATAAPHAGSTGACVHAAAAGSGCYGAADRGCHRCLLVPYLYADIL